ncbi:MAG: glutamate-5-semialdehyde dehydrogenase, partial [Candidatus Diapherotrites archaeon]|nr:glutamate-5-semialdehyde dehydrogenase [Candidatus Diapherotrites archaeon]
VDESADIAKAIRIVVNAKTSRPSVCNAAEKLLVHEKIAEKFIPLAAKALRENGVQLRGDEQTRKIIDCKKATETDWKTEYLDLVMAIKIVKNVDEAIVHINRFGSHHSDAILSKNKKNMERFLQEVDSACVYANASTRFSDGFEFGLGAEIGISTQKMHARGPMGLHAITTTKYVLKGNGEIRE